jgi:hypothetical protein
MAPADPPHDRDADDWFAEPEPPPSRRPEPQYREEEQPAGEPLDDWLETGNAAPARWPYLTDLLADSRALAVVAALALVLLVLGLALGGVFSASTPRQSATTTPPATTQQTTSTSVSTQTTTTAAQAPTTTLKPGDQGPEVKVLQQALAALGYPVGTADGQYGTATKKAVAQFQKASGLTGDGVLGPQTLSALTTALGKRG